MFIHNIILTKHYPDQILWQHQQQRMFLFVIRSHTQKQKHDKNGCSNCGRLIYIFKLYPNKQNDY
jgi:hypothetical protein